MAESTCVVCATSFVLPERGAGRLRTVCSKACQYKRDYRSCDADRRRERNREYNRRWRIENPEKYRAQRSRNVEPPGASKARRERRLRENPEAVREADRRAQRRSKRRSAAKRKLGRAAQGSSGRYVWRAGACLICGANFVSWSHARSCSSACSEDLAKERKRHRRREYKRAKHQRHREAILARDGGVCGICGDPVNLEASVPELDAFTIDHIVPRARGGGDEIENLQSAHFYCNSVKGDRVAA